MSQRLVIRSAMIFLPRSKRAKQVNASERTNERTNEDQKVQSAEVDEVLNMYRRAGERKGELNS
jgi:hypothetical protein